MALEDTADRFVRPSLQDTFVRLCTEAVANYLDRFPFRSDLVKVMFATTDGFSGLSAGWDSPGTGLNFLVHNMCRLNGADGTWMVVEGGMGSITQQLASRAVAAGATIESGTAVEAITVDGGGAATGVQLSTGEVRAKVVLVNGDPFRLRRLLPDTVVPPELDDTLARLHKPGMTMKVQPRTKPPCSATSVHSDGSIEYGVEVGAGQPGAQSAATLHMPADRAGATQRHDPLAATGRRHCLSAPQLCTGVRW